MHASVQLQTLHIICCCDRSCCFACTHDVTDSVTLSLVSMTSSERELSAVDMASRPAMQVSIGGFDGPVEPRLSKAQGSRAWVARARVLGAAEIIGSCALSNACTSRLFAHVHLRATRAGRLDSSCTRSAARLHARARL